MARIGYARVSSKEQNLDRQLEQMKDCKKIFFDKLSGGSLDRNGLNDLILYLRDGDIVVVTELARLGRNNRELTETMDKIRQAGSTLEVLNLPTLKGIEDENLRRLINNLMLEIYKYQAENERNEIRERQRQGIELAKSKGTYKGRKPKYNNNDPRLLHAFELYKTGRYTVKELERVTGIAENTFRRYRKQYNIKKDNE